MVHWYFSQLDSNSSSDISKREMKPFKRYVKKKAKPKKCARRFTDYCDLNKDKVISLPELKGCLGVSKEGECSPHAPSLPARAPPGKGPRLPSRWDPRVWSMLCFVLGVCTLDELMGQVPLLPV